MSKDWYNMIALKNKGYKSNAVFKVEGRSGEDVFEERLIPLLMSAGSALDAGCGDGEFTLRMSRYANELFGFDNSEELLKLANLNLEVSLKTNVKFVYGWTHHPMPFDEASFDLIYCRRGPTSILNHKKLLKPGGKIIGIHSAEMNMVEERLKQNGFSHIEFEIFDEAYSVFPNEQEFIKYLSAFPGNPDYTLPEFVKEANQLIKAHTVNDRIIHKQWRYIWQATHL